MIFRITKIKYFKLLIVVLICFSLFSCKNNESSNESINEAPFVDKLTTDYNLDFTVMHNFVIDSMSEQYTPFFYIKNGEFDISGDNQKKVISISCKCLDGTTVEDLDLFLSLVLNYVSINAAEQDYRFVPPTVDKTGTYIDFGNVFDTYNLSFDCETESGDIIRDNYIKAKENIPIESKYWSE